MRDRALDRPAPLEAEITVARLHRHPRDFRRFNARPMHVELRITEAIGEAYRPVYQLGAHHFDVELIGAFPVSNVDDAVIELRGHRHLTLLASCRRAPLPPCALRRAWHRAPAAVQPCRVGPFSASRNRT